MKINNGQKWVNKNNPKEILTVSKFIDVISDSSDISQKAIEPSWIIKLEQSGIEVKYTDRGSKVNLVASEKYIEENYEFKQ